MHIGYVLSKVMNNKPDRFTTSDNNDYSVLSVADQADLIRISLSGFFKHRELTLT